MGFERRLTLKGIVDVDDRVRVRPVRRERDRNSGSPRNLNESVAGSRLRERIDRPAIWLTWNGPTNVKTSGLEGGHFSVSCRQLVTSKETLNRLTPQRHARATRSDTLHDVLCEQ